MEKMSICVDRASSNLLFDRYLLFCIVLKKAVRSDVASHVTSFISKLE